MGGSSKLKGWGSVVASLDVNPRAKVGRLLKAVERLCTAPGMLEEATGQLAALLTPSQLSKVIIEAATASLTTDEHIQFGADVLRSLGSLDRAALLERELTSLSASECAAVLEPVIIGLPDAQRAVLLPVLIESSRSEDERLALTRLLLEWRSTKPQAQHKHARSFGPPLGDTSVGVVDENNLRAIDLAHADRFLRVLVELWADSAIDRAASLLQAMPQHLRKSACGQILASGAVDALQLEQALELIYNREEEEVEDNPLAKGELSKRRRESAVARNMLREGRAPKLVAGASRVCAAANDDGVDAAAGGWQLTCDCTRQWVLPNALLGKLKGEKGMQAPPLSIRRFEDARFETVEQKAERERNRPARIARDNLAMRSTRSMRRGGVPVMETQLSFPDSSSAGDEPAKPAWHMSTSSLLTVVADLWTSILTDGQLDDARAGRRQLDVSAVLWERLLQKHALKSVAQRALADLTASLQAEASSSSCIGRLRIAAEMIGLGHDDTPWSEAKAHFFFWMLSLCIPQKRMKQHLNDVHVELPLSAVVQFLGLAVTHSGLRDDIIERITPPAPVLQPPNVPEWGTTTDPNIVATGCQSGRDHVSAKSTPAHDSRNGAPRNAGESHQATVHLDTVLDVLMSAWTEDLERAVKQDERRLMHMTRDFDEDGDGVLDFNEFCKLVKNGIGGFDEMLPLYEDVLERTQAMRKAASEAEQQHSGAALSAYTLRIPDAIDPPAFAEVVARRTRRVPPGFYSTRVGADDGDSNAGQASPTRNGQRSSQGSLSGPRVAEAASNFVKAQSWSPGRVPHAGGAGEFNSAELELVAATLASNFLFSSMEREQLMALTQQMGRLEHAEGTRLIKQGEPGDFFYVLVSGHADAMRIEDDNPGEPRPNETASQVAARLMKPHVNGDPEREVMVASYAAHDIDRRCFGERALLQAMPRAASVVLRSPCVLYAMSRRVFRAALRHTRAIDVLGNLRKFGWLGIIPDPDLRALRDTMTERTYDDGEVIVRQGDAADAAFVIISGFARVTKRGGKPDDPEIELHGYLSQSVVFGDTLLVRDGKRAASVIAAGTVRCMQLTRMALERQLDPVVLEEGYARSAHAVKDGRWIAQGLSRSAAPDARAFT